MGTQLHLDLETYSPLPLKKCGSYRYSEDCEVLLAAWAWDDEPTTVWDITNGASPLDLQPMIDAASEVVIHNSMFDRTILRAHGVAVPVDKIIDTMVLAFRHALPGSLDTLCDVLRVPFDQAKDKAGKKLINLFCKPRPKNVKLRRATRETHPNEWQQFTEYARLDVDAMRGVLRRLPRWNDSERERLIWRLDQDSNDRGFAVDTELASAALRAFQRASRALAASATRLTDGAVDSTTQVAKLLTYLREVEGVEISDMQSGTVTSVLQDPELSETARVLLENRQQAAATSPAKYEALLHAVCADGRLRGTMQYSGAARTMRDSGRLFQPQNLPRPSMTYAQILAGIEAMKLDCEDLLYG